MPTQQQMTTIQRTFALLRGHEKRLAFLVVLMVIAQGANISVPFFMKDFIDTLTRYIQYNGTLPYDTLISYAVGILFVTVLASSIQTMYNYRLFVLVTTIEDGIRTQAFKKYLKLHTLFHHEASSGQVIARIERGGNAVYSVLYEIFGQSLLPPVIIFFGAFGALLFQNVWVALAVLVPFPIYVFVVRNLSNSIYEIEQQANERFETVSKVSYDIAGNVLTVKKFSQEEEETRKRQELTKAARESQYDAERLWGRIETAQTAVATVGRVIVLALSAWLVVEGSATIGQFVLFITLQNIAYQPLSQLSIVFPRMRRNMARIERLFALMDEKVWVVDKSDALDLPPLKGQIEFKDVSFSYKHDGHWSLDHVSVVIPAGKTVALVGRSGSGKTTFVNLLLRSFDPQKGAILFDGVDIRDVKQESLREQIAVVPQEVDLFSRTIAENIAYGWHDVTQERIEQAATTALAHDFIKHLEEGYDTVVGERGIKLSGGERQRIGIARAILRDPRLLILDEATSHLDTESERLITKATNVLVKNRTSVIIAHRLSTVINADIIIVFKDGMIEATGTHAELLVSSPTYATLHVLQFANSETDTEDEETFENVPHV